MPWLGELVSAARRRAQAVRISEAPK